jgi:glycerophosphoryl diester phosphodiesterase
MKRMKLQITILLLFFSMTIFAQYTIIAHRGASYLAPENTLASVNLAWELGAEAVEIDVHLTKDNQVMVIHDKDTKRTCSGKQNLTIASSPSMLLRDLDAGVWKDVKFKGEKIPFLSEVIESIPAGKILVVEIKCGSEILPALKRIVEKSGKENQLVFIAFDWKTIVNTKQEFPENKCYWLSESKSTVKKRITEIHKAGLDGINLSNLIVDQGIMDMAKAANVEVLSWTIDDPAEAKRLIDMGVAGITTNRPDWLKSELGKL